MRQPASRHIYIRAAEYPAAAPLLFAVIQESDRAIQIDNGARGVWHCAAILHKQDDGTLVNSAGQVFELVPAEKVRAN